MKTVLIPTDFSETADNAARYAVAFANHIGATRIILYNGYAMPLATEMTWALIDTTDLQKNSEMTLSDAKKTLQPGSNVDIETVSELGYFEERISEIAGKLNADIIVMGITGGGNIERALFGSNALTTIHHTSIPVLTVPPEAEWKPVSNIAWAVDYQHADQATPFQEINRILQLTGAKLHLVHNTPPNKTAASAEATENIRLHQMLNDPGFDVTELAGKDLSKSVNDYVIANGIDWLIVVPRKHSWLSGLFSKDHTSELLFHTHVPMLCLHE